MGASKREIRAWQRIRSLAASSRAAIPKSGFFVMLARACADTRQEFDNFFLFRLFGFETSYGPESCTVSFDAVGPLFNPQGSLHGGVLATAMDISMGHLLHHLAGAGATLEMKVQYLATVTAGRVRCEATFLRKGRSISYLQSKAVRADGEIVAYATSTWRLLNRPAPPAAK
jgi:uncharacterized protein (TIGR00369 family)